MAGFLVDQMLMRLGRWLRLLGQDAANPESSEDRELLQRAISERRTLITRDRRLAEDCRRAGASYILIESSLLEEQLLEMKRQGIDLVLDPRRCTICNCRLQEIEHVEEYSREFINEFTPGPAEPETWRCEGCGKLYWRGSHWSRMRDMLERLKKDST
jgi:uncharacterized protein with PIN domain